MPIHVDDDDEPDAVGYCKPPKHSQFKKGQSGNPTGRRKRLPAPKKWTHPIEKAFLKKITITNGGKTIKMPAFEVVIMMAMKQAIAKSDFKLLKWLTDEIGGFGAFIARQKQEASEAQMKDIEELRKRLNKFLEDDN